MIASRIYEWARTQPTKPAIIFVDQTFSYVAFANAIEAGRSFFEKQRLPVGQTAIVFSQDPLNAWVFVMALRRLGLNTACVPPGSEAGAFKLRNVACFVVPEGQEGHKLNGINSASLVGTKVITVPSAIFANIRASDPPPPPPQAPPFGGHIVFTSGTTGSSKKLLLDGNSEDRRNAARASAYLLNKSTIFQLASAGQWTTVGFRMPSAVWHAGGCVVMDHRPDLSKSFFRHGVNLAVLLPAMLKRLVQSLGPGPNYDDCELVVSGGFLPMALAEETVRRVTKRVSAHYGSTELATRAMESRLGAKDDFYWLAPCPERSVQIMDENGDECPTGQQGELRIRLTDIDCTSYLDDEETSAKVFRQGWFYPGDMAVKRADGRVRILGRTADVLNVRGRKVAVAPIELTIQRSLGVEEVCLFSGLSDAGQEQLVVAIQSDAELPKSVLDPIAGQFSKFERVRFVFFKEFPRTATGARKTQRSVLRRLVFPEQRR
jgi:acyl-coenzyme A synthetase/AMP-(fatty) acid ligase